MPKYTAKQSIGHYRPGQEIKGLEANQLQALLASGAIEEFREREEAKADGTAALIIVLEASVTELTASNKLLSDEKIKSDQENVELKSKVIDLEKTITESQTALKKAISEAKKPSTSVEK